MADFTIRSDSVDVEQIMEQIRARIREKRGVDYSEQQLRELASVKLEKLQNPRVRSDLVEQFKRRRPTIYEPLVVPDLPEHALEYPQYSPQYLPQFLPEYIPQYLTEFMPAPMSPFEPGHVPESWMYTFEAETIYETHRGILRFIRRVLNPILKLFFNPNPIIQALHRQGNLNKLILDRDKQIVDRDRQIVDRDRQMVHRDKQIVERDLQIVDRDRQIADRDKQMAAHLEEREKQLVDRERQLVDAHRLIVERDRLIVERDNVREKQRVERREMDALYYEVIHNLVFELTRLGVENKNLTMRVESIASRLEFNERRARALESVVVYKPDDETAPEQAARPERAPGADSRPVAPGGAPSTGSRAALSTGVGQPPPASGQAGPGTEGPGQRSRRRRRRRGRRGGLPATAIMGGRSLQSPATEAPQDPSTRSAAGSPASPPDSSASPASATSADKAAAPTAAGAHDSSAGTDGRAAGESEDDARGTSPSDESQAQGGRPSAPGGVDPDDQ